MKLIEEINREFETIGVEGITPVRVERLIKMMESERLRLEKRLVKSLGLVEKYRREAKTIEPGLQALQDDLERAFGTKGINISLLYKKSSGSTYIKGRCWWNGKQREVQIGSIPVVLATIRGNKGAPKIADDLSWEALKQDRRLIENVKELGRQKLRAYIARQLQLLYQPGRKAATGMATPMDRVTEDRSIKQHVPTELMGSGDWYSRWHQTHSTTGSRQ